MELATPGARRVVSLEMVRCRDVGTRLRRLTSVSPSEFAVGVLPGAAIRDGRDHGPVLGELAVLDAEQIRRTLQVAAKAAFAGDKNEVAFAGQQMNLGVLQFNAGPRCCGEQSGNAVSDLGIVLNVIVTVEEAGKLDPLPLHRRRFQV